MFFDAPVIDYSQQEQKPMTQFVDPNARRPGGGFERSKESLFTPPPPKEAKDQDKKQSEEDLQIDQEDDNTNQAPNDNQERDPYQQDE